MANLIRRRATVSPESYVARADEYNTHYPAETTCQPRSRCRLALNVARIPVRKPVTVREAMERLTHGPTFIRICLRGLGQGDYVATAREPWRRPDESPQFLASAEVRRRRAVRRHKAAVRSAMLTEAPQTTLEWRPSKPALEALLNPVRAQCCTLCKKEHTNVRGKAP